MRPEVRRLGGRASRNARLSALVATLVTGGLGVPAAAHAATAPLSAVSLMKTVRNYAAQPNHLTGTVREKVEQARIAQDLRADGLKVQTQSYTYPGFLAKKVGLSVDGAKVSSGSVIPLNYSGTTGSTGVSGLLFDGGTGDFYPADVADKIVVLAPTKSEPIDVGSSIASAVAGHALGLVIVTNGPGDDPVWSDTDARYGTGSLPVLEVGKQTGAKLLASADQEDSAALTLTASTRRECSTDVYGTLPGQDTSRRVIVGTPTSSMVPSASERGSGIAILLGLARHYAQQPVSKRPENLVFVATSGHERGFLGLPALITAQPSLFSGADAYVHLGASLGVAGPNGKPASTGLLTYSDNPLLSFVPGAFRAAGELPPTSPLKTVIAGEGAYAYKDGVPTVSFSGGSPVFHTRDDLPRAVSPSVLHGEAEGFATVVSKIAALKAGELRAHNARAVAYGRKVVPDPTLGAGSIAPKTVQNPKPVPHC